MKNHPHEPRRIPGLLDRDEFHCRLKTLLLHVEMLGDTHALCCFNLDQFPLVKSSFGLPAAERLVYEVSEVLKKDLDSGRAISRVGENVFGLILEQCTLDQAAENCRAIRHSINALEFTVAGTLIYLTTSIGIVPVSAQVKSASELTRAVDVLCKQAINAGGNRINVYNDFN